MKKRTSFIDEMNGIFGFAIYDVEKMSILLPVITWVLFHYTLVGINMELLCGFRIESIGRLLHKNSIVFQDII
jgi:hypothetical protein